MVPQQVADGLAALTVRHVGAVILAVEEDDVCGFSSPQVLQSAVVEGALGETGVATWTVEDCVIDLGAEPVALSTDCNGVTTYASGQVTVSASKSIVGRVVGDPMQPTVPESPDAATVTIHDASFRDFQVTDSSSADHMRVVLGSLSATVSPQLAVGVGTGACSEITPHVDFPEITWNPATVLITSKNRTFDVPIGSGRLKATNGRVGDKENRVVGSLEIWGGLRTVSMEGPEGGMNPDYDPAVFEASYTCSDTLDKPVRTTCDLDPVLAENTARLIIKNFGMFVKTADQDTGCGFGNLGDQAAELLSLESLGSLIFGTDQTLVFEADTCPLGGDLFPIYEDCVGTDFVLDGTATVTGTQTVTGQVVFDLTPLHPTVPDGAVVDFSHIDLNEVSVREQRPDTGAPEPFLTMHRGTMSGTYHSITGEAESAPGAYFIKTPVGRFEAIRVQSTPVTLHNGAMRFPMHVDDAELFAMNGSFEGESNYLFGTLTIDGVTWSLGSASAPLVLDPEFEQQRFDATYACTDNLLEVVPAQ